MICSSWSLLTPDRIFARLTGTPSLTKSDWHRRARRVPTKIDLLAPSLCTLWAMNELSMVKVRNVWNSTAISGDPGPLATRTANQLILVVSGGKSDHVWKIRMRNSPCICLLWLQHWKPGGNPTCFAQSLYLASTMASSSSVHSPKDPLSDKIALNLKSIELWILIKLLWPIKFFSSTPTHCYFEQFTVSHIHSGLMHWSRLYIFTLYDFPFILMYKRLLFSPLISTYEWTTMEAPMDLRNSSLLFGLTTIAYNTWSQRPLHMPLTPQSLLGWVTNLMNTSISSFR